MAYHEKIDSRLLSIGPLQRFQQSRPELALRLTHPTPQPEFLFLDFLVGDCSYRMNDQNSFAVVVHGHCPLAIDEPAHLSSTSGVDFDRDSQ
jgi:hypothetical protein